MTQQQHPAFIEPMAARVVRALPTGAEWIYEVKFDGFRALLLKDGTTAQILSRNDKDLTQEYSSVANAVRMLRARQSVIDGEIVALDESGRPSFQALQHPGSNPQYRIAFYAFDLLHLNGIDLTSAPLEDRRAKLADLLEGSTLLLSKELPGTPAEIVAVVQEVGLEGVIAKRKGSRYAAGERNSDWLKLKVEQQQEFVIGGYEPGANGIVDALLVGYFEKEELRFAAKVRSGFIFHVRRDLAKKLKALPITHCPFSNLPNAKPSRWGGGVTADEMKAMQWAEPKLVAQVRFVEWTAEDRLRHARFLGLRSDKRAQDVRRET